MARAGYHVFGLGSGPDDLHYVGWTHRSLSDERDKIFCDLVRSGARDIANWIADAIDRNRISIFEIESAFSVEDAMSSAISLCRYFRSLGLDVLTAGVDDALAQAAPTVPRRTAPFDCCDQDDDGLRGSEHVVKKSKFTQDQIALR
jgi:hypothetical protein